MTERPPLLRCGVGGGRVGRTVRGFVDRRKRAVVCALVAAKVVMLRCSLPSRPDTNHDAVKLTTSVSEQGEAGGERADRPAPDASL